MELFVNNIDKSMEFYSNVLGFNLPKDTNKNYIPVRRGDVVLGLGEMENLPREHPLRVHEGQSVGLGIEIVLEVDRKSTRLNSSHVAISYAVFCLKKKKNEE